LINGMGHDPTKFAKSGAAHNLGCDLPAWFQDDLLKPRGLI
jgi:hypothetical protein